MTKNISKNAIYGGYEIYHPEGYLMFRCDERRYKWYLSRNLSKETGDRKAQLLFTPKHHGHHNDKNTYFLSKKENKCVVCGKLEDLTRHHVVPIQYRRHLPKEYIDHKWFDILVLCEGCHHHYEEEADKLKKVLEKEYNAVFYAEKEEYDIISNINSLKVHSNTIPKDKVQLLIDKINTFYKASYSLEDIQKIELPPLRRSVNTGKMVVDNYTKEKDIKTFIVMWRKHFLEVMDPKNLEESWKENHETQF